MSNSEGKMRCTMTCWGAGLAIGAGAGLVTRILAGLDATASVFLGVVVFIVAGALMRYLFCRPLPTLADVQARHAAMRAGQATGGAAGAASAAVAGGHGGESRAAAPAATADRTQVAGSATTPGAVDVDPAPVTVAGAASPFAAAAAPGVIPEATNTPPASTAADGGKGAAEITGVRPGAAAKADGTLDVADAPAETTARAAGHDGGTKPSGLLSAPRGSGPDDLTRIKGIGPALEAGLHRMGVYHFDQIAAWSPAEVGWVDANLEGFKGRASRDDWVGQARVFAADAAGGRA